MRSFVLLAALATLTSAFIVPRGDAAIMDGALCKPCINLITNGENNAMGDFNTWFDKETAALCSPLGFAKNECIAYFKKYEQDFDHFITTDADPRTSCQSIDFCDKPATSAPKI